MSSNIGTLSCEVMGTFEIISILYFIKIHLHQFIKNTANFEFTFLMSKFFFSIEKVGPNFFYYIKIQSLH